MRMGLFWFALLLGLGQVAGVTLEPLPNEREPPTPSALDDQVTEGNPLMKAFVKNTPHIPAETAQKMGADIMQEAREQDEATAREAGKCIIDWDAPCPMLWKETNDGGDTHCTAPDEYKGFCETRVSLAAYSSESKQSWAKSCQVEWPCKGDEKHACLSGRRDFSFPCPEGFLVQEDGEKCIPNLAQYSGDCAEEVMFAHLSDGAKQSWSEICGASWPCYEECADEYDAWCPDSWTHVGNFQCVAPRYYDKVGPCGSSWNFRYYTMGMKRKFEQACKVHFPCANTCDKDYETLCPTKWVTEAGNCKAPQEYTGCSVGPVEFQSLDAGRKKELETECNMEWPCKPKDHCSRNWSLPCPEGWQAIAPPGANFEKDRNQQQLQGIMCTPPTDYTGKCKGTEEFVSEDDKRRWASYCDQPWPCEGEETGLTPSGTKHALSATTVPAKGRRGPRLPYPIDLPQIGRTGPIKHETGEVMPKARTNKEKFESIYGQHPSAKYPPPRKLPKNSFELQESANSNQVPEVPEYLKQYDSGPHGYQMSGYYLLGSHN